VSKATPSTESATDTFAGDWYYGSDCDFGHYVTLGLKRSGNGYIGDWSDGTRVRGSQGDLRGTIRNDELVVQRCDDGSDVGGEPDCPTFEPAHDIFVRDGDSLVWSHAYNGERSPYVTLRRAVQKVDLRAECEDDVDAEGTE
jgi:hypothetical protein